MKKFINESMFEIIKYFEYILKDNSIIEIEVLNPDLGINEYSGFNTNLKENYIYRSYKSWIDLSELMFCKMFTPTVISHETICLKFQKIDVSNTFHKLENDDENEKYGLESSFFDIN